MVDQIYLETLAQGITELTSQQFNTVSAIAHQCILEGGNAVLDAQILYQMQEDKSFSDDSLCNAAERARISSRIPSVQKSIIKIVPNPANEVLQITDLSGDINRKHIVTIFDVNGKQVMKTEFTGLQVTLSINNLQNGVYTCRIEGDNGFIAAQKVVIIH